MNTANLQLRKQDQVAWIQIDRPAKLNAINKEVLKEPNFKIIPEEDQNDDT